MKENEFWSDFVASDRDEMEMMVEEFVRNFHSKYDKLSLEPKCGIGKTESEIKMILWAYEHWNSHTVQFVIAAPNHQLCDEIVERLIAEGLPKDEISHIYGKNQLCYYEPKHFLHECKGCSKRDDCKYIAQEWNTFVAVIPFQLVHMRGNSKRRRILVYDECPFSNWILTEEITDADEIELGVGVDEWNAKGIHFKHYFNPKLKKSFEVIDSHTESISNIMRYKAEVMVGKIAKTGKKVLFVENSNIYPEIYDKVIYSSATTPFSIREKIFGRGGWRRFIGKAMEQNPVIPVGKWGGLEQQKDFLPNLQDKIEFLMRDFKRIKHQDMKVFIATRDKTKKLLASWSKSLSIDVVHYNQLGINSFNKAYDLAIVYGKMKFNDLDRYIYSKFLSDYEIDALEVSTVVQALHRCRLILHIDTPVMLIKTNKDVMENSVNLRFTNDIFLKLDNLPFDKKYKRSEMMKELGCNEREARALVNFRKHMRDYVFFLNSKESIFGLKQQGYNLSEIIEILDITKSAYYKRLSKEKKQMKLQKSDQNETKPKL